MPKTLKYIQCMGCESIYPRAQAGSPCVMCENTEAPGRWHPWDPTAGEAPSRQSLIQIIDSLLEALDCLDELHNEEENRLYNDAADAIIAVAHHYQHREWYYMEEETTHAPE